MRISDWSSDVCSSDHWLRRTEKLGWLGRFHDFSAVHENNAVSDFFGEPHFVGNANHGHAVLSKLNHCIKNLFDHFRIQRRGGLVEQHDFGRHAEASRSEEHTSELQSLMRISYAVFCLKKKNTPT